MNSKLPIKPIFASLLLVAGVASIAVFPTQTVAGGDDHDDHVEARQLLEHGKILPLSRILEIVHARVAGDVIEVELEHSHHHGWEYEVKVLDRHGDVREVKLFADTGVIREIEDD
ncbi:MAG TPA: PepSY domain-containing protein [Oleiagrimonas sp.]|nr:PepSY domain-containing protein [Oleiagrimonas sp.]